MKKPINTGSHFYFCHLIIIYVFEIKTIFPLIDFLEAIISFPHAPSNIRFA